MPCWAKWDISEKTVENKECKLDTGSILKHVHTGQLVENAYSSILK